MPEFAFIYKFLWVRIVAIRLYTHNPLHINQTFRLEKEPSRHLLTVLRCQIGEQCIVFNGNGKESVAQLVAVHSRQAELRVIEERELENESPLNIHLLQGVSRGERMDYAIQKAVECGVKEITPIFTARCNVKLSGDRVEKRCRHWQSVAVSAAEQSGRAIVPVINSPCTLIQSLDNNQGLGFVADTQTQTTDKLGWALETNVKVMIGPEGGFNQEELKLCYANGLQSLSLGPRILRTETASVVAITLLQARWGDMQWFNAD